MKVEEIAHIESEVVQRDKRVVDGVIIMLSLMDVGFLRYCLGRDANAHSGLWSAAYSRTLFRELLKIETPEYDRQCPDWREELNLKRQLV